MPKKSLKPQSRKRIIKESAVENIQTQEIPDEMEKSRGSGITPLKIISVFVILFLFYLVIRNFKAPGNVIDTQNLKSKIIPDAVSKIVGDASLKVKEISELKDVSGVYEFEMTLDNGTAPQKYTSYITKDGKLLFQGGIKLDTLTAVPKKADSTQTKITCDNITKSDNPTLSAFIVSQCPFGLQMQRVYKKVIAEQGALEPYLKIKYIGSIENGKITSMHGDKEAEENLKQICIREEQKPKFWEYLGCYMKEGKTDECLSQTGVNISMLNTCVTDSNKGLKYAKADFDLSAKYSIGSSPTLLLNETQTVSESEFGGRTANAIKEIVCCSNGKKADFCAKDLSKDNVATSFSVNETVTNTNAAANCGQ
jgi:hypothetical protein